MENQEWVSGKVRLSLYGQPVEMEMTVPAKPVKPSRMLPILQAMTSAFVELGVSVVEAQGEKISCKAGCGACCRQAVPLAEAEVYQISELVEKMPEPRRTQIKRRFAEGARRFHENGWFEKMESYPQLSAKDRLDLVMEYFYEGVPCPFLEDESCSIHPDRPLACREYLVTSDPAHCARPTAETIRQMRMKIKPSIAVLEMSLTKNLGNEFFVPMIRALEWAETHADIAEEKTGEEWMAEFFRRLSKAEIQASEADGEAR